MTLANGITDFAIEGVALVPGSARGLKMTLKPIENGKIKHDLRGVAYSSARASLNLYGLDVTCDDVSPPAFAGLWPSPTVLYVHVPLMMQLASLPPVRPSASGEFVYLDEAQNVVAKDRAVFVMTAFRMKMLLEAVSWNPSEWDPSVPWALRFVETN